MRGEGTRVAGLQEVWNTLAAWQVPLEGVELDDGSGLSRNDRLTCDAIVAVLEHVGVDSELAASLPVAGVSGTLADELVGGPAEGRLAAKTGTLTGVRALSGFLPTDDGLMTFALVLNGEGVDDPVYLPTAVVASRHVARRLPDRSRGRRVRPAAERVGTAAPRADLASGCHAGRVAVMPMFPLGTVLLPGGILPLHIFEPRYRQLVADLLADDVNEPEFGVTMIERGKETGGGEDRADVGVVARVVQIEALEDGRYGLVAVGTWRFRVRSWLPDDPYPLADIDALARRRSGRPAPLELIAAARERIRDIHRRVAELVQRDPAVAAPDQLDAMPPNPRSVTTRCSRPTTSPASRRSVRPIATDCCAPTRRGSASNCSTQALDDVVAMIEFRRT